MPSDRTILKLLNCRYWSGLSAPPFSAVPDTEKWMASICCNAPLLRSSTVMEKWVVALPRKVVSWLMTISCITFPSASKGVRVMSRSMGRVLTASPSYSKQEAASDMPDMSRFKSGKVSS